MKNKKILTMILPLLGLAWLLSAGQAAAAPINSGSDALVQATSLRTLSQRMLKFYALTGLDVRARKSASELAQNMQAFSEQLGELQAFARDDASRSHLDAVANRWATVKPLLEAAPNKGNVPQLQAQTDTLLQACDQAVKALKATSGLPGASLVDLAGQQAMLSQRIAALYALMAWGFEADNTGRYEESYQQAEKTFRALTGDARNTSASTAALDALERQFGRLALSGRNTKSGYLPGLIDRSAEKMLDSSNQTTALYASF